MLHNLQSILDDIDDAMHLVDEEDFEGALPILARVVAFGPAEVSAPAYELWAHCHLQLGRIERALQIADEGLARGVLPFELQLIRADALRVLERYDEAEAAAEAARELDPDSPDPIQARADIEIDRGQLDSALRLLQDGVRRHPGEDHLHATLVEVADRLERAPLVIESARDFLRKFGKDAGVLAALGRAYVRTRDYRRADRAFRDAAQLEPDEREHHMNVLAVAVLMENDAAYDAYLDRLAEYDPELADAVHRGMGDVLASVSAGEEPGHRGERRPRPRNR